MSILPYVPKNPVILTSHQRSDILPLEISFSRPSIWLSSDVTSILQLREVERPMSNIEPGKAMLAITVCKPVWQSRWVFSTSKAGAISVKQPVHIFEGKRVFTKQSLGQECILYARQSQFGI